MKRSEIDRLVELALCACGTRHAEANARAAIVRALEAQREADAALCEANELSHSASIIRSRPVEED